MKSILSLILLFTCISSFSQAGSEIPIKEQFDYVALNWLGESESLKSYAGIDKYCQSPEYRASVNSLLDEIHGFDSLILSKLSDPTSYLNFNAKEERKTFSDIKSMESEYGTKNFVKKMRESCAFRNEIEANADDLKNGVGYESYDAKVMLLETDMVRYLKKVDKLILKIDDHLHVLDVN